MYGGILTQSARSPPLMGSLVDWAKNELKLWNVDNDGFGEMASNNVLEVMKKLTKESENA